MNSYAVYDDAGNRQGEPMQLTGYEARELASDIPEGWTVKRVTDE